MLTALVVAGACALYDVVCVLWVAAISHRNAGMAAVVSAMSATLSCFTTSGYIHEEGLVVAVVAGHALGAWLAVKFFIRGVSEAKPHESAGHQ